MFTDQEKTFLVNLLNQVSIKPADGNASETVALVQSILKQLQIEKLEE